MKWDYLPGTYYAFFFFFFLPPCLFIWNIFSLIPDSWLTLLYLSLLKSYPLFFNAILMVASLWSLSSFSRTCPLLNPNGFLQFSSGPISHYMYLCSSLNILTSTTSESYCISQYLADVIIRKFELKNFPKIPTVLGCAEVS